MQTIELVLSNASYAKQLKRLLATNGSWPVTIQDTPHFDKGGVVVLDNNTLATIGSAPDYPDRVVLVTPNDQATLAHAWELGIRSVVFDTDSPATTMLAIMSAYLRLPRRGEAGPRGGISPNAPSPLLDIDPTTPPRNRH